MAPNHKTGLALANPVMPASGCFGFGPEYNQLVDTAMLGAIVVGPVTARARRGAEPPRLVPVAGGVLLHTGLANPGVAAVVRRYGRRAWARSPVPVIVHVAGISPGETASCCRRLYGVEAVAGIELGIWDAATPDDVTDAVQAARDAVSQPLIVRLPLFGADVLCTVAVEAGADALTVAAPPRGAVWYEPGQRFVTGRLYGPFVLPQALYVLRRVVQRVVERVAVPVIGCGGIHDVEGAEAFLRAGAVAIQVDGALWRDPACLVRIAQGLASSD